MISVRVRRLAIFCIVATATSSPGQEWQGWLHPSQQWGSYSGQECYPASVILLKSVTTINGQVYGNALLMPTGANNGTNAFLIRRIGYSGWNTTEDRSPAFLDFNVLNGGHTCGGFALLDDTEGTVLIAGGDNPPDGIKGTSIFREQTSWADLHVDMNFGRYHPTLLWTPDGRATMFGGTETGDSLVDQVETITPSFASGWPNLQTLGQWQVSPEVDTQHFCRYYPQMYVMPDGRYLHAGPYADPSYSSRLFDPLTHLWSKYGSINGDQSLSVEATYPSSTMLVVQETQGPKAYVVRAGGVRSEKKGPNGEIYLAIPNASILDVTQSTPSWQKLPSGGPPEKQGKLNQSRCNFLMISLPNRTVLAMNGNEYGLYNELQGGPVSDFRKPELFDLNLWIADHNAGSWVSCAAPVNQNDAIPRGAHSTAWLMPDGRVFVGGGDTDSWSDPRRTTVQFWSPPYLAIPNRPVIRTFPVGDLYYGQTYHLSLQAASRPVKRVSLVTFAMQTHGFIQNNRYVELKWNAATSSFEMPANANWAPPGWYMLFVEDSAGAVSQAKVVRITDGYSRSVPSYAEVNGGQVDETKLRAGDNGYLPFAVSSGQSKTLIVKSTVPDNALNKVRLRIEQRSQGGTGLPGYTVDIRDYVNNQWVSVVAARTVTSQDRLDVLEFAGSKNYRSGTGEMQMRVNYTSFSMTPTTIFVDEVQFGTRSEGGFVLPPPK